MRKLTYWASLLFIVSIPLESTMRISGLGSGARLLGLVLMGLWLGSVLRSGALRRPRPIHFLFLIFIFWQATTILWTYNPLQSKERLETYIQVFVLTIIIWDLYTSTTKVDWALQAFVTSSWILTVAIIRNQITGNYYGFSRFTGFGADPNTIGVMLVLAIAMAWYLTTKTHNDRILKWLKPINYVFLPAAFFAAFLTASRTATVAMVIAGIYVILLGNRMRWYSRILLIVTLLASLAVVRTYIPEASLNRVSETQESIQEGNLTGRGELWVAGLQVFVEQPLLGYGVGTFSTVSGTGRPAHSVPITILVESGMIGLILYILMLIALLAEIFSMPRQDARFWAVLLAIWFIGSLTLNWAQEKHTWFLFALIVAAAHAVQPVTMGRALLPSRGRNPQSVRPTFSY